MKRRRGIALMTALIIMMLVSTTILALGTLFAAQARRSRALPDTAQEEQLLLAGAQAVLARLNAGGSADAFEVKVPPEAHGFTLTCQPEPGATSDNVWYKVQVRKGGAARVQRIRVVGKTGVWGIQGAVL